LWRRRPKGSKNIPEPIDLQATLETSRIEKGRRGRPKGGKNKPKAEPTG
jgi:hypothetical protein